MSKSLSARGDGSGKRKRRDVLTGLDVQLVAAKAALTPAAVS